MDVVAQSSQPGAALVLAIVYQVRQRHGCIPAHMSTSTVCHVHGAAQRACGRDDERGDQGAISATLVYNNITCLQVDENQNVLHYCSRAAVTDELESTLPPFMVVLE